MDGRTAVGGYLAVIGVRPPAVLAAVLHETVIRAATRAPGDRAEPIEETEAAAAQAREERWSGGKRALSHHVVDRASELGPERERPGAPNHLDALQRLGRRRVIRLGIAERVRGNVHS